MGQQVIPTPLQYFEPFPLERFSASGLQRCDRFGTSVVFTLYRTKMIIGENGLEQPTRQGAFEVEVPFDTVGPAVLLTCSTLGLVMVDHVLPGVRRLVA